MCSRSHKQRKVLFRLLFSLWTLTAACGLGADKNGVAPGAISLPKGPGALEGLGESFQPSLNTGTANYGFVLQLPPGTAGHAPSLRLSYDGGLGNGPLGVGWSLLMPGIQRRSDKGIPTYGQNLGVARSDVFINEAREELAAMADGFFFCRNENAFIRYRQVNGGWEGTLPNGTRLDFGLVAASRVENSSTTNQVFGWLLERAADTHGNTIVYAYTNFPGSNDLNQKYLELVTYGVGPPPWNNFHFVRFVYEDRPDWFEDCRPGFPVRTGKRLKEIAIGTQGPALTNHASGDFSGDGFPDYLDRKYLLTYLSENGTNHYCSLLSSITLIGADGSSALPPASFGYTVSKPPQTLSASGHIIGGANEPPLVMDSSSVEFLDLNGDGLPDILRTEPGGGSHTAWLNGGLVTNNGAEEIQWEPATGVDSADSQAWLYNLQSTAPIAHLADMNGDGVADLVVTALDGEVFYFANESSLAWGPRRAMSVQDVAPPSPFSGSTVRMADIDFDKRVDVIQSLSSGGGADYRIWFNMGNESYSASTTVSQNPGYLFSDPGVQIVDWNGDRVPDVVRVQPALITVTAGLGYGRFAPAITVPIPDWLLDETQVSKASLTDINGDGLADLVLERASPGELWYWLNLGNYALSQRRIITGMPAAIGANAVTRWADVNGNGSTDLVYADSTAEPRLQSIDLGLLINGGATPNMMTAISNGIGRVTLIGYESSTHYALQDAAAGHPWPNAQPAAFQVVSQITTLDSLGHSYLTRLRYHDGYYDPAEKQFRGFASAEQIEVGDGSAPTLVTRSLFDTGVTYEILKGKLLSLSTEDEDGSVFSVQTNQWRLPPLTLRIATNGTNVVWTHPLSRTTLISEQGRGTPKVLREDFAFDLYGNEITNANFGIVTNGNISAFDDERIVATQFAINTNSWILRLPAAQQITDENGNAVSRSELFYDDETFSGANLGAVTLGNLTLRRDWITPTNTASFVSSIRRKYDAWGNAIWLLDPLASAPGGAINVATGHVRQIEYDSRFRAYPVTEMINIGAGQLPLRAVAQYDEGLAAALFTDDFNTNRTLYAYDAFARLQSIARPGDSLQYPTSEYSYGLAVPFGGGIVNYIETRRRDQADVLASKAAMYLHSREYTDGLGRKLMTRQEAEPAVSGGLARVVVTGATLHNARQRPFKMLNPFFTQVAGDLSDLLGFEDVAAPGWAGWFQQGTNLVSLDLPLAHKTTAAYDALLRPAGTTNQDGSFRYSTYEPLMERHVDEEQSRVGSPFYGNAVVLNKDGLNRLVEMDEITGLNDDGTPAATKQTWRTLFRYDVNDNRTETIDSQQNTKLASFDGLRRKTFSNDPDRGQMSFLYDAASNLQETIDARSQHVLWDYDGVNRMISETYAGSQLSPRRGADRGEGTVNVAYHYDSPAGAIDQGDGSVAVAKNTRGLLAYVSDGAGEEHTSYDARGRAEWVVKRIPDPDFLALNSVPGAAPLVSYRTQFAYDPMDRATRMVYPDNDEITCTYNARGLLEQIPSAGGFIVSNILYSPAGVESLIALGNGVQTIKGFDSRLRLSSLKSVRRPFGTELLDFTYTRDGASNIQAIQDERSYATLPQDNARRNTQVFAYDDLYRLKRAEFNPAVPGQNSSSNFVTFRFDRLGNLLQQTSDLKGEDRGLPAANLGSLGYGGALGTSNRLGRVALDPPGPHALTSLQNASSTNHNFAYDANGNVSSLADAVFTWDFKDRLVQVEDSEFRAEYFYDATDRRVLKLVHKKGSGLASSTAYINALFEVRDHDTPEKYVYANGTRIAHVTGSLSSNVRVQKLRFHPGWNLCSTAVSLTNATAQFANSEPPGALTSVFRWDAGTSNYASIVSGAPLGAGTVLWVYASTNVELAVVGAYGEPRGQSVGSGGNFVTSAGLEQWLVTNTLSLQSTMKWLPYSNAWSALLVPASPATAPIPVSPGEALFVIAASPASLQIPPANLRIRYYHADHLGSCSVMSDENGALLEETSYFPFGAVRNHYNASLLSEPYQFAQKERDSESGLQYFGKRFYHPLLARWLTTDPMQEDGGDLNLYAYARQNPLKFTDPDGGEVTVEARKEGKKMHYSIKVTAVLVNDSALLEKKGFTEDQLKAFAASMEKTIKEKYTGGDKKASWSMDIKISVIKSGEDTGKNHVFHIIDPKASTTGAGDAFVGGTKMHIMGYNLTQPKPDNPKYAQVWKSPEGVGAHELGHTMGLEHWEIHHQIQNDDDKANLMYSHRDWDGMRVTRGQIEQVYELYKAKKLNDYSR